MHAGTRRGGWLWSLAALAGALCGLSLTASEPTAESPTKDELAGLTRLHRDAVKRFIDRNGFGFSRMEPPLADVLGPPKSQAQSPASGRPAGTDPAAIRPGTDAKDAHFSFAKAVGGTAILPAAAGKKTWVVKDVQLVGLVKHKNPVVYLGGGASEAPMAKGEKGKEEAKTRPLDEFEEKALEVIRGGGESVQAEKQGDSLRAMSGIFAGKRCSTCHERAGEMLGAFSYRLSLEEPPAKKAELGPFDRR